MSYYGIEGFHGFVHRVARKPKCSGGNYCTLAIAQIALGGVTILFLYAFVVASLSFVK